MDKFQELFELYKLEMTDQQVTDEVNRIINAHFDENNNVEVWKQCLSQIDLTTLNGADTVEKVQRMAENVNHFQEQFQIQKSLLQLHLQVQDYSISGVQW